MAYGNYYRLPTELAGPMGLTGSQHRVLSYLVRCGNAGRGIFPSYKTIGDNCELSRRQAMRIVKQLEKKGYISKTLRPLSDGNNSSNFYAVHVSGCIGPGDTARQDVDGLVTQVSSPGDSGVAQKISMGRRASLRKVSGSSRQDGPLRREDASGSFSPRSSREAVPFSEIRDELASEEPEGTELVAAFLDEFERIRGKPHWPLKPKTWRDCVLEISTFDKGEDGKYGTDDLTLRDIPRFVEHYLQKKYKAPHSLSHFVIGRIREIINYEIGLV